MVQEILSIAFVLRQFMYEIQETFLFFRGQGYLVSEVGISAGKAVIQVCLSGTASFQVIGIDGYNDPFMLHIVNLGQVMALILVNEKNVSGIKIIKPVINQKLFSAGDRIIDFIAVVDVDIHGLFIAVQMRGGEGLRFNTGADALLTGTAEFHDGSSFDH